MTMKDTTIHNHDMIEFDVAPNPHKFCILTICAIDYTDTDTDMSTMELKSKKGGGSTPLGTIKIGS